MPIRRLIATLSNLTLLEEDSVIGGEPLSCGEAITLVTMIIKGLDHADVGYSDV